MEVLAGARNDTDLERIAGILARGRDIAVDVRHFESAAVIHRMCGKEGITVRSLIDCLIAAIALSEDVEVLHHDRDFNAIARVVPLRIHPESLTG